DVGDSKFTEVHLDQNGNVIKAKYLTGECLVSEWDASVAGKIVMTQNGHKGPSTTSLALIPTKFGGQIPLNWNRPSDGMLSTVAMASCSGKFDLSQGYNQYVDVNIVFDQEWFLQMTNQSLSDGIQSALMGQDEAAWRHFSSYNQEMAGHLFTLSYIIANQL
ncbi:MAG TPA: hypothetical protein PLO43_04905, partial [Chlamydiales bacterium]|nr:hypothetical protein [Chlamydiales bacterium]